MAKHEEIEITYTCDICGELIEDYSEEYSRFEKLDICFDCREKLKSWLKRGEEKGAER